MSLQFQELSWWARRARRGIRAWGIFKEKEVSAQVSDFAEEKKLFKLCGIFRLTERSWLLMQVSLNRLLTVTKLKRRRKGKVWEVGCWSCCCGGHKSNPLANVELFVCQTAQQWFYVRNRCSWCLVYCASVWRPYSAQLLLSGLYRQYNPLGLVQHGRKWVGWLC